MSEKFYAEIGEYIPDSLITSTKVGLITKGIVLKSNQGILKRGSLIGKTTDNTFILMGSQGEMAIEGILIDDIDTSSITTTILYISGCFNKEAVIVAEGHNVEEYDRELRNLNIYLETVLN